MTILVIAEHTQDALRPATLACITAAMQLGAPIDLLIAGHGCAAAASQGAICEGISRVLVADRPACAHMQAEVLAPLLVTLAGEYTHVFAPATPFGKDVLPRAAALLDVTQVSDITQVIDASTFVRPIYAGAALAKIQINESIKLISVRPSAFDGVAQNAQAPAPIVAIEAISSDAPTPIYERFEALTLARPALGSAKVVVGGGRALGSKAHFGLIEALADKFGGAVGATRAACDAGFIDNDAQIGQTGKVIASALYISIGISGAVQHVSGIKDAKVIVAINNDANAPIFKHADYGLVGDLFEIVPALLEQL